MFTLIITVRSKARFQQLIGESARLRQSVHSLTNFDVDPAVDCKRVESVLYPNFHGDHVKAKSHIFEAGQWCAQIIIPDVHGHELCMIVGDDSIEEDLCSC